MRSQRKYTAWFEKYWFINYLYLFALLSVSFTIIQKNLKKKKASSKIKQFVINIISAILCKTAMKPHVAMIYQPQL